MRKSLAQLVRLGLVEGALDRGCLTSEQRRSTLGDYHNIFQPYSELARNVDSRFIAEAHARLKFGLVPLHQIGPFMTIQSDAVSKSMSEVLVTWTEARILDHFASSTINFFASYAGSRSLETGCLSLFDGFPNPTLSIGRLAENDRASYVGGVALNAAATVHQYNLALLQSLGGNGSVGRRGIFAEEHQRAASSPHLLMGFADSTAELRMRHAFVQGFRCKLERLERDSIGDSHNFDLVTRLHSPAASGDRIGARQLQRGCGLSDSVRE